MCPDPIVDDEFVLYADVLFGRLPPPALVVLLVLLIVVRALLPPLTPGLAVPAFDVALVNLRIAGFGAGVSAKPKDCMIVSASGENRPGCPVGGDRIGVIPPFGLNKLIPFVVDHIESGPPGVGSPSIIFALK